MEARPSSHSRCEVACVKALLDRHSCCVGCHGWRHAEAEAGFLPAYLQTSCVGDAQDGERETECQGYEILLSG